MYYNVIKTKNEWIEFLRTAQIYNYCYIPKCAKEEPESNFPGLVIWYIQNRDGREDLFHYKIIDQFEIQEIYDDVFGFISQSKGIPT